MIKRVGKNLTVLTAEVPAGSVQLERDGYTVLRDVLSRDEIDAIAAEIDDAVRALSRRSAAATDKDEFRYEMLNRGAASQAAVGHDRILEVIEPLLGDDCHVIANTAWRNPPTSAAGPWHCDAGPHVPRPEGVEWDDRIPYPVFAIGAHLMLQDCPVSCGPTAVVPGSHIAAVASRRSTGSPIPTSPTTAGRRCCSRPTRATSRCSCPTCGIAARPRAAATAGCSCRRTTAGATSRSASARPPRSTTSRPRRSSVRQTQRRARPRRPAPPLLLRRVAGVRWPRAPRRSWL